MRNVVRLGLTGGIGSGKSTVAGLLAKHSASVVDADAISRELTAVGGLAIPMIASAFGPEFISPAGALERDKMRALVYADDAARQQLESIIHPLVGLETQRLTGLVTAQGCACLVFDIPLLVESGRWRSKLDLVLVVDCTPEVQIERVMARNQLARQEVDKIMAAQSGRAERLRAADIVLFNDRLSLAELAQEVSQMCGRFGLSSVLRTATRTTPA